MGKLRPGSSGYCSGGLGAGAPTSSNRSTGPPNPLQYYCISCTGALRRAPERDSPASECDTCVNWTVPSGRLWSTPRALRVPNATSRTVSEASLDTSRRQLFLGVGGSGRSPLECPSSGFCRWASQFSAQEQGNRAAHTARFQPIAASCCY